MAIKPVKPNERLGRKTITPTMSTGLPPLSKVTPGKLPNESGGRTLGKPTGRLAAFRNNKNLTDDAPVSRNKSPLNRNPRRR